MTPEEIKANIQNCLDEEGKIKRYPSKYKFKVIAQFYLTSKFEADIRYTEKEVNGILDNWHTFNDSSLLRRELIAAHFLNREKNGSAYWLESIQPKFEDFKI